MLYVAEVTLCSQINTKHTNTVWTKRTVVECQNTLVRHVTRKFYMVNS